MTQRNHPKDWQEYTLATIAIPRLGGNYRNSSIPSARPLIKMGNLARVNIDLTRLDYIEPSERIFPEHRLQYGDVLFNTRNTLDLVGKVSIWRNELPIAYYNSNILRLELNEEYRGSSSYFCYALNAKRSVDAIRALATGTTSVAAVYTRDLLNLKILVPPATERLRIAAALTDVDDLIAALIRGIAKKEAIKQGIMQQLLTGEIRLPGHTKPWDMTTAGTLGSFRGGSGFPLRFQGTARGEYPFFKVSDMSAPGNTLFMNRARHYVSEAQREQIGATSFPTDAIVFAKVGAAVFLERKRILRQPSCIDNNMAALILDKTRADARYVHYALTAFRMSSLVAVTALPSLNGGQLRSIPLSIPTSLAEQRAIAAVINDVDSEIDKLRSTLAKVKSIKQGMMQELLTGRTRLPAMKEAAT